ncbi:MAG: hypothetical protein RQ723_06535 [Desulfuromonadales bacterium]|nr:hypothetical protein [Desulfuromonadales bacterium]
MTLFFPLLQLCGLLACLPAYRVARRRQDEPVWSLFLVTPAFLVWIGMTLSGLGANVAGHLAELFDLVLLTIVLYYIKVFLLDRRNGSPVFNNLLVVAATSGVAILLRVQAG